MIDPIITYLYRLFKLDVNNSSCDAVIHRSRDATRQLRTQCYRVTQNPFTPLLNEQGLIHGLRMRSDVGSQPAWAHSNLYEMSSCDRIPHDV